MSSSRHMESLPTSLNCTTTKIWMKCEVAGKQLFYFVDSNSCPNFIYHMADEPHIEYVKIFLHPLPCYSLANNFWTRKRFSMGRWYWPPLVWDQHACCWSCDVIFSVSVWRWRVVRGEWMNQSQPWQLGRLAGSGGNHFPDENLKCKDAKMTICLAKIVSLYFYKWILWKCRRNFLPSGGRIGQA